MCSYDAGLTFYAASPVGGFFQKEDVQQRDNVANPATGSLSCPGGYTPFPVKSQARVRDLFGSRATCGAGCRASFLAEGAIAPGGPS